MDVKPADIGLFRVTSDSGWFSKLIGWGQKWIGQAPTVVAYDHAVIFDTPTSITEAFWPRVRRRDFDPIGYEGLEVYRVKNITPDAVSKVLAYATSHLGEWYNLTGILTFGLVQLGHTAVCSQFVWEAFTAAGIVLCPYESLESPDDIGASSLLIRVS
jgi:uncharacterized protein YycO